MTNLFEEPPPIGRLAYGVRRRIVAALSSFMGTAMSGRSQYPEAPLRTRRSFTRGTPRSLLGSMYCGIDSPTTTRSSMRDRRGAGGIWDFRPKRKAQIRPSRLLAGAGKPPSYCSPQPRPSSGLGSHISGLHLGRAWRIWRARRRPGWRTGSQYLRGIGWSWLPRVARCS
jgi:hypothetical protein